jgi:nitroimidazol reductase NimA-like FMN-containing flavoprotein (pyridoxamine 5'-phosphate oxidase superfamily)
MGLGSREASVDETAIKILDSHRIMAISTVRPDGWPQTTIVGYANDGLTIYFLIFRSSQKFANIAHDDRVSIAIGEEPRNLRELNAVYAGGHASEVTDLKQAEHAWRLLTNRHPNLSHFEVPEKTETALMCVQCKYRSVLDYGARPIPQQ